ncbi:MAG: hypothetical protein QXN96_04175 [Candidatus Bathyarchaeia archaeon]
MKIEERERACLGLLRKLPKRFVLIGGYAASSYEFPRFSVDLDLVVSSRDLGEIEEVIKKEGFTLVKEKGEFSKWYKGKILRFEKKVDSLPISVDLFVDFVQARQTDAAYSFDYLWRNSENRKVTGFGIKESVEARVANREMLIALKMNSMRIADQRDIIALCTGEVDLSKLVSHLKRAPREKILKNIETLISTLENPESRDSIKGVFGISDRVYKRITDKAKRQVALIKNGLS